MKRGLIILTVLVILIAGGIYFFLSKLDTLITMAVKTYGSEITQAKVDLKETRISAQTGEGTMRGLSIGNPKGFHTDSAFRLGEIKLVLDVNSLVEDTVVVKEIVITAPEVTYELGTEGSNIDAIQKNVNDYLGPSKAKDPAKEDKGKGKKLIIESLRIEKGKINVSMTALEGKKMSADLPPIHLTNIGKDKGGATPGEVVKKIYDALNKNITKAIAPLGLGNILNAASDIAKGATKMIEKGAEGALDSLKKTPAKEVTDLVGKGAEGVGDAVKGLFGN